MIEIESERIRSDMNKTWKILVLAWLILLAALFLVLIFAVFSDDEPQVQTHEAEQTTEDFHPIKTEPGRTQEETSPSTEPYEKDDYYVEIGNPSARFPSLKDAFRSIEGRVWSKTDVVKIYLTGTVKTDEAETVLFGQKTIWTTAQTKLPIIIEGYGSAEIRIGSARVACANDYTFRKMDILLGDKDSQTQFFAGVGDVSFEHVTLNRIKTGGDMTAHFYADNFTLDVFEGWNRARMEVLKNRDGDRKLSSSLTFGIGTRYVHVSSHDTAPALSAVGFDGEAFEGDPLSFAVSASPADFKTKFVVSGGTTSRIGARVGLAPVSEATVELKSGTADSIVGDSHTDDPETPEVYVGNTVLRVSGGSVPGSAGIRGLCYATQKGDLTIEISGIHYGFNPTRISSVEGTLFAYVEGTATLNISGGIIERKACGGAAKRTVNLISGGIIGGDFFALGSGSSEIVTTTVVGGTFEGVVWAGQISHTPDSAEIGGGNLPPVCNLLIQGGTFRKDIIAGSEDPEGPKATVTVHATVADITFYGTLSPRKAPAGSGVAPQDGPIILKGGSYSLLLTQNTTLIFSQYNGSGQNVVQTQAWKNGNLYLQIPESSDYRRIYLSNVEGISGSAAVSLTDGTYRWIYRRNEAPPATPDTSDTENPPAVTP